ncbi:MAG: SRPBCC domain-containing protein [Nitrospinota bacterium]
MISIKNSFLCDKPAGEVFGLFSRIDRLAWAFPTVSRVDVIDDDNVNVGVVLKLGLLPLDNNLSLGVTERASPVRLVAEGVATPGAGLARAAKLVDSEGATRIEMILDLEDLGPEKSRVRYEITCDATGNLKRIYDAIIKGQRKKLESEFIKNVAEIMQAPIVEEQPIGA